MIIYTYIVQIANATLPLYIVRSHVLMNTAFWLWILNVRERERERWMISCSVGNQCLWDLQQMHEMRGNQHENDQLFWLNSKFVRFTTNVRSKRKQTWKWSAVLIDFKDFICIELNVNHAVLNMDPLHISLNFHKLKLLCHRTLYY